MRRFRAADAALCRIGSRWDNRQMATHRLEHQGLVDIATPLKRRVLMWIVLSVLAALLGYFGFRGYLNPELLFHFANSLYC